MQSTPMIGMNSSVGMRRIFDHLLGQDHPGHPHGHGGKQQDGGHFQDKSRVFKGDHRSGSDAVQHEGAKEHGCRRAAGNTEIEQGDHRPADAGVVRRFAGK